MRVWHMGLAATFALALAACGQQTATHDPQALTDETTKAVYNNDINAMQANFDDSLKKQVTLDQVGIVSQKLKALGAYKGLTQTAADSEKGRYDYTAAFDNGSVAVHVRLDPGGELAAYHVDVPGVSTAAK